MKPKYFEFYLLIFATIILNTVSAKPQQNIPNPRQRDPRIFSFIRDFFTPSTVEIGSGGFHQKQGYPTHQYPVANAPFPAGNGGNLVDVEDLSAIQSLFKLGSNSMEGLLNKVNHFDKLKCIPRLLCQTIAKRQEDAKLAEELEALRPTIRTTTTTVKPKKRSKSRPKRRRDRRTVKIQGVETALEQFVAFLDLMQLKDWVLYPYLQGAYEGSQSKKSHECTTKFSTCPFSDTQLVHYFNNYNGGFFNSFQSEKVIGEH